MKLEAHHWTEFDDALHDVDAVLDLLCPTAKVVKAERKLDPLSDRGLLQRIRSLARALRRAVSKMERDALKATIEELKGTDWLTLSDAARANRIVTAAASVFAAGEDISAVVEPKILDHFARMARDSAKAAGGTSIVPTFDAVDEGVIEHAALSQSHYVRNEFGARAEQLSRTARGIVGRGIRQGLDPTTIGGDLERILSKQGLARSRAYWDSVASIHMVRARSFGQLKGFDSAGIRRFVNMAVLDEATTRQCRFMHGREFEVSAGLSAYQAVAEAGPESVVELQPFLQFGRLKDADGNLTGDPVIYYKRGEERIEVAQVVEDAFGKKDEEGKFRATMDDGALSAAGVLTPPYHGRCRTTIRPVV